MVGTRRQFLRRAGIGALGTAVGLVALPTPPPSQPAERPDGLETHQDGHIPTITAEIETPYAIWQYRRHRDRYEPTSPINVVVSLANTDRSVDDVMEVLWDARWYPRPLEYVRYAYNAFTDEYERVHISAAGTFAGAFGRHHIRVWAFDDFVSIQAHEDTAATPEHEIASYERTKWLIEGLFDAEGWSVTPDGANFSNATGPDHTGLVTVIE